MWTEEKDILKMYRKTCNKIHSILYYLRLKTPLRMIEHAMREADKMAAMAPVSANRPLTRYCCPHRIYRHVF